LLSNVRVLLGVQSVATGVSYSMRKSRGASTLMNAYPEERIRESDLESVIALNCVDDPPDQMTTQNVRDDHT